MKDRLGDEGGKEEFPTGLFRTVTVSCEREKAGPGCDGPFLSAGDLFPSLGRLGCGRGVCVWKTFSAVSGIFSLTSHKAQLSIPVVKEKRDENVILG